MSWYKTGTISVTNGSSTVYGSGTLFVDIGILNPGDMWLAPDEKQYEILSFQSNTEFTLVGAYLGTTVSGASYAIVPIGLLPSTLAQQVKATLTTANTALASAVLSNTNAQGLTPTQQQNARTNIAALSAADVGAGRLSKSVAGNTDVTLTAVEAANQFLEFTGVLTGNINVIVPTAARLFSIYNATSGAYTLTVKTAAGSGIAVRQGGRMFVECDSVNVINPNFGDINGLAGSFTDVVSTAITDQSTGSIGSVYSHEIINAHAGTVGSWTGSIYRWQKGNVNTNQGFFGAVMVTGSGNTESAFVWGLKPLATASAITEYMRLTTTGLTVNGTENINSATADQYAMSLIHSAAGTGAAGPLGLFIHYSSGTPNGAGNDFISCRDSTAYRLVVRSNGNVENTNNSYGAISDIKVKENITDCTPKLDNLNRVRVVNYNLIGDPSHKQIGVIAQELEQVFPSLIAESPDYEDIKKSRTVEVLAVVDEAGNEITAATTKTEEYVERIPLGTVTKSVKYSVFVPMLIKALQELDAKFETYVASHP
ncbi:MAG: tail fiber domain-containing protein [Gallionellaceae bacterium]|jgi:hypothetical protein